MLGHHERPFFIVKVSVSQVACRDLIPTVTQNFEFKIAATHFTDTKHLRNSVIDHVCNTSSETPFSLI